MYKFIDINETQTSNALPSEAMTFNGKIFENEIDGYRTLSVSGRELMGKNIIEQGIDGLDGSVFLDATYPPRPITVKYQLVARNISEFRSKFNQLNFLLSKNEATLSFADESNYQFVGTLSEVAEVKGGVFNVVSTFTILCTDPFKYKVANVVSGTGNLTITNDLMYEVLPTEIKVTPTAQTNTIKIKNETQNKVLSITNTFVADVPILIYPRSQEIIRNNTNYPNFLDWTSDFENFTLRKGDKITVTPSCSVEIKIRERML